MNRVYKLLLPLWLLRCWFLITSISRVSKKRAFDFSPQGPHLGLREKSGSLLWSVKWHPHIYGYLAYLVSKIRRLEISKNSNLPSRGSNFTRTSRTPLLTNIASQSVIKTIPDRALVSHSFTWCKLSLSRLVGFDPKYKCNENAYHPKNWQQISSIKWIAHTKPYRKSRVKKK